MISTRLIRLAATGGLLLLVLPLAETWWWVFGLPSHFPLQIAAGGLAFCLLAAALRERLAAFVLSLVVVVSLFHARDYLPRVATAQAAAGDLTVVVLNLDWRNPNPGRAIEWLERVRPDLVVLPEYTPEAARRMEALRDVYPHRLEAPREEAWGIAVLSRLPVSVGRVIFPANVDSPAIDAIVDFDGEPVRLVGVHPRPPISARYTADRNAQLDAVAALVAGESRTTLVCGDFNDTPFSASFRAFLRRARLASAGAAQGYPATYPAGWLPVWIPIDHCAYRGRLEPVRVQPGPDVGSDHYPLYLEFRVGSDYVETGEPPG